MEDKRPPDEMPIGSGSSKSPMEQQSTSDPVSAITIDNEDLVRRYASNLTKIKNILSSGWEEPDLSDANNESEVSPDSNPLSQRNSHYSPTEKEVFNFTKNRNGVSDDTDDDTYDHEEFEPELEASHDQDIEADELEHAIGDAFIGINMAVLTN